MINEVIRNYEVSLWTLQDEFITVLKWSDVEYLAGNVTQKPTYISLNQKGTIQDPSFTIIDDGTQQFTFSIPMYIYDMGELKENPIWYNTRNGNLIVNLRKVKVVFNKNSQVGKKVFEFLITKVTEEHEKDQLICNVECEGLAFHELGKVGYVYSLSAADFELDYKNWQEKGVYESRNKELIESKPVQNINYWCEKIGLDYEPSNASQIDSRRWYFRIEMNWSSFQQSDFDRDNDKVYEEEFATEWQLKNNKLIPKVIENAREKERTIEVNESNIYNITQTIAETFQVYCRYEYQHDTNNHITRRTVVFFNNYLHDDNIFSISYPYNATKITREIDSTDLVTQLYVKSVENSATIMGEDSIRYCTANKTQEDYIFNFDYLKETGSITDEQYEALDQYEADLFRINTALYPIENKIAVYEAEKVDLEAKLTFYTNSIKIDKEQIDTNSDLRASLTANNQHGAEAGLIGSINEDNPEYAIIQKDTQDNYYISLNSKNKGIKTDTVHVYRTYNSSAAADSKLTNELTNIQFEYDDYGNASKIYNVAPINNKSSVYMIYDYEPKLYYDAIVKTWTEKLANDEAAQTDIDTQLNHQVKGIKHLLEVAEKEQEDLLSEKRKIIEEFRLMMGPAIREGNWTPEDYIDYGERCEHTETFANTYNNSFMTTTAGTKFTVGWDTKLFDGEQDIYYKASVNENKIYYSCIDLSPLLNDENFFENVTEYSFIFNNNYYKDLTQEESALIKNIRSFSIGSEAILGFIKEANNTIKPVLILVGAKNMTDEMIGHMEDVNKGNPRIGKLSVNTDNNGEITGTIRVDDPHTVGTNQELSFLSIDDNNPPVIVIPRIKFSSLMLKINDSLFIRSNGTYLENYKDYYIRTRNIEDNKTYAPEYLITLKPEAFLRDKKLNNEININYSLSNASTAIYLDALEIAKENAYPKVSYTVDPSILNKDIVSTLYNKLNWLVMINDAQLKFENVFGYISKIELQLDFPNKDKIEIKNYSGKFEDLFTNIVAQTEEMKKNAGLMAALANGTYALPSAGFNDTLSQNDLILQAYLDSHFDSSEVVKNKLAEIFNEAGAILADSSSALGTINSLTLENASILSSFAEDIASDLCTHTYVSNTKPEKFKPGDIWIDGEGDHWVATGYSSDDNKEGTKGFVRTRDGSLASITGAGMNVDAEKGLVDIYAANELNLRSGKHVYIGANDAVDIVGNQAVNIGGTTINIVSEGNDDSMCGINLVSNKNLNSNEKIKINNYKNQPNVTNATIWQPNHVYTKGEYVKQENKYYRCKISHTSGDSWNAANWEDTLEGDINNAINSTSISKVLIHPDKIELGSADILMRGANKIQMVTSRGTSDDTSAIEINPDTGVWIGSGQGIRIFSGGFSYDANTNTLTKTAATGASVELNDQHLILGYKNTQGSGNAIELDKDKIIIASGSTVVGNGAIALNKDNSITGMKLTRTSFGLAVGTGNSRSVILADGNGLTIGSGSNPKSEALTGSYVTISGKGVEIGSLGNLYLNTSNIKLQSDSKYGTRFALGSNLNSTDGISSASNMGTVGLVYNTNGLYINGNVYATTFIAPGNGSQFKASSGELGFYNGNNGILTINSSGNITAGGNLTLSAGKSFSVNVSNSGSININSTNFKVNSAATGESAIFYAGTTNDYIEYSSTNGLRVKGTITATSGSIGGWTLSSNCIANATTATASKAGIRWTSGNDDSDTVFWAGHTAGNEQIWNGSVFAVNKQGDLKATSADITGKITANEGEIGGYWHIGTKMLTNNADDYTEKVFLGYKKQDNNPIEWIMYAGANDPEGPGSGANWGGDRTNWAPFRLSTKGELYTEILCLGNGPANVAGDTRCGGNGWADYVGKLWLFVKVADNDYQWKCIDSTALWKAVTTSPANTNDGQSTYTPVVKPSSGCFIEGTQINLPNGKYIEIEKLRLKDEVLSYNPITKKPDISEVGLIQMLKNKTVYNLYLSNNTIITVTDSHPFLTFRGWAALNSEQALKEHFVETKVLKEGDILMTINNEYVKLQKIEKIGTATVYNLGVAPHHTFIVNNVIVHNTFNGSTHYIKNA